MSNSKFEKYFIDSCQEMQKAIHKNAVEKGFWKNLGKELDGVKIALMHSELSEALEVMREGNKKSKKVPQISHLEEELADVVIRIMDFAEARGLNLGIAILLKHKYNCDRPYMHGGKNFNMFYKN